MSSTAVITPEIYEASRGIWCVRTARRAAYIVKTSPGAVLIDVGLDGSAADMMLGLQEVRVGLSSVRAILLTSGCIESAPAALALQRRSRAKAFCSERAAKRLGIMLDVRTVGDGDVVAEHFEVVPPRSGGSEKLCFYFRPARALFVGDSDFDGASLEVQTLLGASGPSPPPAHRTA